MQTKIKSSNDVQILSFSVKAVSRCAQSMDACPAQRPCSLHSGHPRISLCAVHTVNDFKEPRSCVRLLGFKGSREQWHAPETDKAVRRS